jgi:diguanylate cyclase (GGDEF)-like protein
MPLLRESTSTSDLIQAFSPDAGRPPSPRGRRRGARVRARILGTRRRARGPIWDVEALKLPEPLLTARMAQDFDLPPGEDDDLADTAEWAPEQTVQAIDLSDGPKLIKHSEIGSAPAVPAPRRPESVAPAVPKPPLEPISAPGEIMDAESSHFSRYFPITEETAPIRIPVPAASLGRIEAPEPAGLVSEPARLPEALLATVLSMVASVVAWGSTAPAQAWVPLSVLPAVGLLALLLPGRTAGRTLRAAALLLAAAGLPLLSATMTPVSLVIALAVVATYPMLVGPRAGGTITGLAIGSLATPLLVQLLTADTDRPYLRLDPDGTELTAQRLALASGILVVALIGISMIATRRALTSTASIAAAQERTARVAGAQISLAAASDLTTGLPNRNALLRATELTLDATDLRLRRSSPTQVGLLLIDIDRFAELADTLGAAIADHAADQLAERLRREYPAEQYIARVGRHQFALLLPAAGDETCATQARRITELMAAPIESAGRALSITCSMGAALTGAGLLTADDLLRAADEAVRAAQRTGRSRWMMFDQAVHAHTRSQATLELELRDAVLLKTIEVSFQPLLALGTGDTDDRIVGAEALATWTSSNGTVIDPQRFLPMAEELGLGGQLSLQVIERALAALVVWRHEGVGVDQVWVNLAPSQLDDPDFAHEVAAQLAIRGLAPSSLVLEIGADRLPGSETARTTLDLLRSLGIAVALDNFGRSGTSLSDLRRLSISAVKLDPALALELDRNDAVPRSITQLGHTLGLRVVVEGVESVLQLQAAREIHADAVQGCAIARPMSAEDITNLLTLRLPREFRLHTTGLD